jgi:hypothetical protein
MYDVIKLGLGGSRYIIRLNLENEVIGVFRDALRPLGDWDRGLSLKEDHENRKWYREVYRR